MFQNISKAKEQEEIEDYQETNKDIDFKKIFSIRDIVIYCISFLLCFVNFKFFFLSPFAIAIFAASMSNRNPIIISFIIILARSNNKIRNIWSFNIYIYCNFINNIHINI